MTTTTPTAPSPGLKGTIKALAYASGMLGLYHRLRNRDTLTVSMFHRVLPLSDPRHAGADPEWTMTPDTFRHCLRFFQRHYRLVSAEQVFAALDNGAALPPRAMLVSFDDGWADTAEFAAPVLAECGVQALVFVAAGAVDRAAPFWEERVFSFLATPDNGLARLADAMAARQLPALDQPARPGRASEAQIRAAIAQLGTCARAEVLALAAGLPDDTQAMPAMFTSAQLAAVAGAGHAIGGHGMTHQPLTRVADLEQELRAAQDTIAAHLRRGVVASMSLPHGASSAAVLAHSRAAGYRYLFTSQAHLNTVTPAGAGPVGTIGRIHISERAIHSTPGRFDPVQLATWLFLRPIQPIRHPEGG